MFSARFHWHTAPNRLACELERLRAASTPILDLTESNPTRAGLHYPAAISSAFVSPDILTYHPTPIGLGAAREAVSGYYAARGHSVDPGRIVLTASTSEAYAYLFKLLTDPGDHVLVPRPSYPLFEYLANMESLEIRQYPLAYHGAWTIDMGALAAAITPRTRAIVLVNPNNPTGNFITRAELEELERLALAHDLALISDEVFSDYAFAPAADRVSLVAAGTECLSFSMNGLSKAAGLPQVKLGWIVRGGDDGLRREALDKLEWIADTYLSVGTPVQCAAARLLELGEEVQRQIRQRTAANLAYVRQRLAGSSATLLHVEAGWYATLQVPRIRSEEDWALELLTRRRVLVQPGFFYDFESEAFLVLSLLTQADVFRAGLNACLEGL